MKNKVYLLFVPAVLAIALALHNYASQLKTRKLHEALMGHVTNDPFYASFTKNYFTVYRQEIGKVCINQQFDPNCLNILIINNGEGNERLSEYQDNILAVGSNLIVIGQDFFDLILVSSNYAFKSRMAGLIFERSGFLPFEADVLWLQRYTDLFRNHLAGGRGVATEADRIKNGVSGMESMDYREIPEELLQSSNPHKISTFVQISGFAVFIEHEIGHLSITPARRLWLRIKSLMNGGFSERQKLEEDLVDQVAFHALNKVMEDMLRVIPELEGTNIDLTPLYANFQFFWIHGMYDYFQKLRDPIFAEDFFFEINFDDCYLDEKVYNAIPDEVLAMVPVMWKARLKPLPILTEREFTQLLNTLTSVSTHSHSAIRAAHLYEQFEIKLSASDKSIDTEGFEIIKGLIEMAHNKSKKGVSKNHSKAPTNLMLSTLLTAIEKAGVNAQLGFLCPTQSCMIASKDGVYIEVLLDGQSIVEVSLMAPFSDKQTYALSEKIIELFSTQMDVDMTKLKKIIKNIVNKCPGSYESIKSEVTEELLYINHMATPSYFMARYSSAKH